jgi:hypothetical protein
VDDLEDGAGLFPESESLAELRSPPALASMPERASGSGGWRGESMSIPGTRH